MQPFSDPLPLPKKEKITSREQLQRLIYTGDPKTVKALVIDCKDFKLDTKQLTEHFTRLKYLRIQKGENCILDIPSLEYCTLDLTGTVTISNCPKLHSLNVRQRLSSSKNFAVHFDSILPALRRLNINGNSEDHSRVSSFLGTNTFEFCPELERLEVKNIGYSVPEEDWLKKQTKLRYLWDGVDAWNRDDDHNGRRPVITT